MDLWFAAVPNVLGHFDHEHDNLSAAFDDA
jgi:hypothetical protein